MADADREFDIGHPAPFRDRVGFRVLMFGLIGSALAWLAQLLLIYGFATAACLGSAGAQPVQFWGVGPMPLLIAFNIAGWLVALLSTLISYRNWRDTRREADGHLLEAGEGRTRFIAAWGFWGGLWFLVAIAVNTMTLFWVPLCQI